MTKSKLRGHDIEENNGVFIFSDNKEKTVGIDRPCGHCGLDRTKDGHDYCLGTLKGLMNACCGHGDIKETYIQLLDGFTIRGKDALIIIDILKKEQ
jgi:hypothetical protein